MRPHEEQTPLERTLRSHLWTPTDALKRATEKLPQHVRRKEYREAAECQTRIIKAEFEIKKWTHLLELYEAERQMCRLTPEEAVKSIQEHFGDKLSMLAD